MHRHVCMPVILFPAHAGVILLSGIDRGVTPTFPRTRGGDPLGELFKGIADAIRAKSGQTGEIFACDFADRIRAL